LICSSTFCACASAAIDAVSAAEAVTRLTREIMR
jgi:hypothetical protein